MSLRLRSMSRSVHLAGIVHLLALSALLSTLAACSGPPKPLRMEAGVELPSFTLPSLDGSEVSSDSFGAGGKVTVVNFWATWCQPCRKEMPELSAMAEDPRVEVVGIALDEEGAATVAPFVAEHRIEFPILLGNQEIFQRLGGHAIPYTLVLDSDRKVINVHRGPTTEADLENDLRIASR